jgi:sugar lactone lactonase YvrE
MLPLCFEGSCSRFLSAGSLHRQGVALVRAASVAALFGAAACSSDDDGGTVALADSGVVARLTDGEIGIPTTVAVADGVAWIVESQFDRYEPFVGAGAGAPAPFRLIGLQLNGNTYNEIPLPADFFPEGIAATQGGRLFVGSVRTGSIYTVAPGADQAEIFSSDLDPSTIGMTVGTDNQTLWVCNTNLTVTPPVGQVVGLGISDRGIVGRHELPPGDTGSFCNDLVMSPNGALWITESNGGRIFRIAPENLSVDNSAELWLQDENLTGPMPGTFGANGITLLGGRLYTVVTDRAALFSIDPTLENPTGDDLRVVSLTDRVGERVRLVRPDGITAIPGSNTDMLIVENGLGAEGGKQVLRARLDRL